MFYLKRIVLSVNETVVLSPSPGYLIINKNKFTYYMKRDSHARIFIKINTIVIHMLQYTSIVLSCILKESFQKPTHWIFCFFSYSC